MPANPIQSEETTSAKMLFTMGGVGCIAGLLIVMTFHLTLPRIERLQREYLEKSVYEILPRTSSIQPYEVSGKSLIKSDGKDKEKTYVYAGYDDNDKLTGLGIKAVGQGFQDKILMLYGYDLQRQRIVGMKVLEHKETPGLGNKIENADNPEVEDSREDFADNFKDLSVAWDLKKGEPIHPITVVKERKDEKKDGEIDAITGATISSKAVGKILRDSVSQLSPIILLKDNLRKLKEKK